MFVLFIIQAYSTSDTWYALLDMGTNYCNLRNILDGTGMSNQLGKVYKFIIINLTLYGITELSWGVDHGKLDGFGWFLNNYDFCDAFQMTYLYMGQIEKVLSSEIPRSMT